MKHSSIESAAFDEANINLGSPEGCTEEQVRTIRAWMGKYPDSGQPVIITCWKPSVADLEEIKKTGRIWLHLWGKVMPPVCLTTDFPFERQVPHP